MYAHLFSVQFKNGNVAAIFVFDPHDNKVLFWPISRKLGISYHYSHIGSHI